MPALLYEKRDHIATVTMNRPEVRNAINAEMLCRLADAWQDIIDDDDVRVAILTGAGDDAFCAGADLDKLIGMMQGVRPTETEYDERIKNDLSVLYKGLLRNIEVHKPIIAAVKGFCVAGGTEILQCTDIRIAADDAQFGISEVKRGLFPMGGSTARLPRQISWCQAMELLLTGERIPASEAWRIGLVNRLVPAAKVMDEARRVAATIIENGPLAVQAVKKSAMACSGLTLAQALDKEMEIGLTIGASEDAKEGARAFKEKRKPVFRGR